MLITTKFNVNDEVYFLHPTGRQIAKGRISRISIEVIGMPKYTNGDKRDLIWNGEYQVKDGEPIPIFRIDDRISDELISLTEQQLFITKEDCKETLLEQIKNL